MSSDEEPARDAVRRRARGARRAVRDLGARRSRRTPASRWPRPADGARRGRLLRARRRSLRARARATHTRSTAAICSCPIRLRASIPTTCTRRARSSTRTRSSGPTSSWRGRPWREAVIYELHVGTFTPAGHLRRGRRARLDYLADARRHRDRADAARRHARHAQLGLRRRAAVRARARLRTARGAQALRQAAHARGLMVLLDVVYNHFGPEGNYLRPLRAAVLHGSPPHAVGQRDQLRRRLERDRAPILHSQRALLARGIPLRRAAARRGARDRRRLQSELPRRARSGRPFARLRSCACTSCSRTTTTTRATCAAARMASRRPTTRSGTTTSITRCTCCSRGEARGHYDDYDRTRPRSYCARCSRGSPIRASTRAIAGRRAASRARSCLRKRS